MLVVNADSAEILAVKAKTAHPQKCRNLPAYALAGVAMEFMGTTHQEKYINGNNTEETDYWLKLGRDGLRTALRK